MKTFNYTIQDEIGIHAKPAGLLAKKAKEFQSVITLEGADEETAAAAMEEFFRQICNLL